MAATGMGEAVSSNLRVSTVADPSMLPVPAAWRIAHRGIGTSPDICGSGSREWKGRVVRSSHPYVVAPWPSATGLFRASWTALSSAGGIAGTDLMASPPAVNARCRAT